MAHTFRKKDRKGKFYPVWFYSYVDATGKRIQRKGWPSEAKTKKHSDSVEADARAIRTGEKEAPSAWSVKRNTPIESVVAEYLGWGKLQGGRLHRGWDDQHGKLVKASIEWWKNRLALVTLSDINLERVETEIRVELLAGAAPKTIGLKAQNLKALIAWAMKHDYLLNSPLRGMSRLDFKARDPHRKLTDAEVAALLAVVPPHRRLWYETGMQTGFRVNELRLMRIRDLDVFGPCLYQPPEFSKDRKEHRQPITRKLADQLAALREGKGSDFPLLDIPTSKAWKIFKRDCESAKIALEVKEQIGEKTITRKATWHSLRKVYISNLFASGLDLKTIQTLGRLSSTELAVEVYAVSDPASLRAGAEAASNRMNDAVKSAACCAGVAQKAVGAEGVLVNAFSPNELQLKSVIGATGD